MITITKASPQDASKLLKIQKQVFQKYTDKYGEFDRNPADMSLSRMKFNINYQFGQYYIIKKDDDIIGGLFAFEMDVVNTMKIAQFYILDWFQNQGIGTQTLNFIFDHNPQIKHCYVDTIYEEKHNLAFYRRNGFEIIDEEGYAAFEEDHEGLKFCNLERSC